MRWIDPVRIGGVILAHDSIELRLRAKVQQEADLEIRGAQVVVDLTRRGPVKLGCGLRFNDELVIDEHVQSFAAKLFAFVHHHDAHFARDRMASPAQLPLESHDIEVLPEAISKGVLNLEEGADHGMCERLFDQTASRHSPR